MPERLDLSVDRKSEVAVGTQLIWKLRSLIANGALPPGAKLPGIREVAETAAVNVNTVRSVFSKLEDQGLLVSEHGRGTFVAKGARLDAKLAEATELVLAAARDSGVNPQELAAAVFVSPTMPATLAPGRGRANERQALYREIERLERDIAELDPPGPPERAPAEAQPRMLGVAELRAVREELVARVDQLRRQRQEWRLESERLREAERREAERDAAASRRGDHPWRAGVWTGRPGPAVSWTRA